MQLLLQAVLPLVPVEQRAQDGGETVLSQRAHGAYQLGEENTQRANACLCLAVNIPKQEIVISVSSVYLCSSLRRDTQDELGEMKLPQLITH